MEMIKLLVTRIVPYLVFLVGGILIGLSFCKTGCGTKGGSSIVRDTLVKIDTAWIPSIPLPAPQPKVIVKTKIITDSIIDSLYFPQITYEYVHDTVLENVAVNYYEDSLFTDSHIIICAMNISGTLESLDHKIKLREDYVYPVVKETYYEKQKPNWTIGAGLSNELSYKASVGYKGFNLEPAFNSNGFREIFLTKTFSLYAKPKR